MALAKRQTIKKKPKKDVVINRTSKASVVTEEKNVGRLTSDWSNFNSYEEAKWAIYESVRHLNYFYGLKDFKKFAIEYCKKFEPKLTKSLSSSEDWRFYSLGPWCKLLSLGAPLPLKTQTNIKTQLKEIADTAAKQANSVDVEVTTEPTISPALRLKRKTSDFIAEIEAVIDDFLKGVSLDIENYSVYNELQRIIAAPATAQEVVKYYKPQLQELMDVASKKDKELAEGYRNMPAKKLKEFIQLLKTIIADAERYLSAKKATRAVRAPKVKTASQQVSTLKFAKDSAEFKIASVDPQNIIGAEQLFLFDVKYRTLTMLSTSNASGFAVKGTTIINVDSAQKKKLRKPDEVLSVILKATKPKAAATFNAIKTKPAEANARCGENTIILKVYS